MHRVNTEDKDMYSGTIDLRGPYSPLEISYYSLVNSGSCRRVRVERDSLNYVTLDDDPTNDTNRMLVAADVSLNEEGSTMILRKTCLMPKIPGLSTILSLLFAPMIELRLDPTGNDFIGAICGLGYDEQNDAPIYSDNDIELVFDTKIKLEDIKQVSY